MKTLVLGEDDGFLDLAIRPAVSDADPHPAEVTVRVDTVKTLNDLAAMTRGAGAESESAFLSAASEYFQSLGLPRLSHKATAAAVVAIADRVRVASAETTAHQG
jgi:hypothetical protein